MSDMKKRLSYYGGGYQKGQVHIATVLMLGVILLGLLTLFDPLGLSGIGTYTGTEKYVRCDAGLKNENGDLIGYLCRVVEGKVTYGEPRMFATLFYTAIVLLTAILVALLLSPQRAMDKLAHKLAAAKTLGLLEDEA
ncbi:hypothetical protein HY493_00005 [Candidatus Woesearchaeota archaeon]|nr:hypothetical protein [Candidatus Woesearchaeota archaeon]